jgi:hypothetical protein
MVQASRTFQASLKKREETIPGHYLIGLTLHKLGYVAEQLGQGQSMCVVPFNSSHTC